MGGHTADSCSKCPTTSCNNQSGNCGQNWCNGDCTWSDNKCIKKVNCGGHKAKNCSECPTTSCPNQSGNCGRNWCNGDCL